MKKFVCTLLAVSTALAFCACGGNTSDNIPSTPGDQTTGIIDYNGTININLPTKDFPYENNALVAVANAYTALHPETKIVVQQKDSSTYKDWIDSQFAGGDTVTETDIVQTLLISNTYQRSKLVDFSDYLVKTNPYSSGVVWKDSMRSDAYPLSQDRTGIYSLSYTNTMSLFFYNKTLWKNAGLVDAEGNDLVPETWDELVSFCQRIKEYTSAVPFAAGGQTYTTNAMSWLFNIYCDQYYRGVVETTHAVAGDYCYDPDIDATWKYDATDKDNDSPSVYTNNMLRFLRGINEGEFGPSDAKFKAMMENFLKLIPTYTQSNFTSNNYYQAEELFWSGKAALVYETSDFFNTYKQIFTARPDAEQFDIGFFLAPPMTGEGDTAPDADYVRSVGGAYGYYGVVKKDKAHTDLVLDFMMFWGSKQGQDVFNKSMEDNGAFVSGSSLINGVEIPESIFPAKDIEFPGLCHNNPMGNLFGNMCALNGSAAQSFNYLTRQVFDSSSSLTVSKYGDQLAKALKDYMADYIASLGWKENCLENVSKTPNI